MQASKTDNDVLNGPIISTFLRYAIPSILGLLAITTASIVDGIFIGQFVSAEGLAAITLLIPFFTLVFAIALMLSIGGAVRAGNYLGQNNIEAASAVFSKCLISIFIVGLLFMSISYMLDRQILSLLGAPEELIALVLPYFHIICMVLVMQVTSMVLYYFIRLDNNQKLATSALVAGALINIVLDAIFIIALEMGLKGAAWATFTAQIIQMLILSVYFVRKQRRLKLILRPGNWSEVAKVSYNGLSEFVNELSGGMVILLLNWLLVIYQGVSGLAAFAVINYLIFISLMIYYGIADALHLLISQNHGAAQARRIHDFVITALAMVFAVSIILVSVLLLYPQWLIQLFLQEGALESQQLSAEFIQLVWPLFAVNGLNVTLSVYLTAMQKPLPSMSVALSRGFILPVGLLLLLSAWLPDKQFLIALPLAEGLTLILAIILCWKYSPGRIIH
ncbi:MULTISPECIES: MATE family efflux transporter [unclassified Methylophaga]|jgi:putative MATE family efflux protein|uniref:MATE family efflux transporter n=1 Tax=unclassified Methylophaga TaxID=2629249 RepID=UPI000C89D53B|nr:MULTISPECIES: MATE family efflux transporter [unclassified Methylophaga]MAK67264.1 multidrug transporter MatE [Methylophaga sp.]MAY18301.1 multidrug transporter MatE [Methylophaga sp.]HAO25766.1 multidrug transporter MatE [Methylophaga sp.]HCD03862.1 multidrug transporter MatE [Methylophaga sp.]|tara:strand:- start:7793 stop:9139 length:1347 start_codon:yes stop_codon:yes gene_type:complete